MQRFTLLSLTFLLTIVPAAIIAQVTAEDGDWAAKTVRLSNTPEAELMIRTGDIDNLNFGWQANFDPFSGGNTPVHGFPWAVDSTDPGGTDRVLVISSYNGSPPRGQDGYTGSTSRPANSVTPIALAVLADSVTIESAILQIFVDDFQAPIWGASYEVMLNGVRVPFLETIINSLQQTGPIGKIISAEVPSEYLFLLESDTLNVLIDDFTTGAGDGFAIDFVKLLINPSEIAQTGTVTGTVTDNGTGQALSDVRVVANGLAADTTDSTGAYTLEGVLAGLVTIEASRAGYGNEVQLVNVVAGFSSTVDFTLESPAPEVLHLIPADSSYGVSTDAVVEVLFNTEMDSSTFNATNFILSDTASTLSGIFTKTDSSFVFTPDSGLSDNNEYLAVITTGVQDINGVSLSQSVNWFFSTGILTGISQTPRSVRPKTAVLQPNYPNPFNPETTIAYQVLKGGSVELQVFDVQGRTVRSLLKAQQVAGHYQVRWDGRNDDGDLVSSGVYFIHLNLNGVFTSRPMVFSK